MKKSNQLLLTLTFLAFLANMPAQSVSELIAGYTGQVEWDNSTKTVTFLSTGQITFSGKGEVSWLWEIPTDVKPVFIKKDIRVNGECPSFASVTIEGEDRKTSEVYGTNERKWADNRGIKAYTICTFQNFGGTMTLKNLSSLNPRGFHVRGWGKKMMVSYCDFLDDRGGSGNHSDGVEGGDGSVFDNCYFETGDDIFKVYFDIIVTNCVVNMVENTVPIQLGWGNYSNGAVGTFKNLKIYGTSGRGAVSNAIINGRSGVYNVTVNIDGCDIENPNATWVTLNESTTGLNCNVKNARINVYAHVGKYLNGPYSFSICGSNEKLGQYNCSTTHIKSIDQPGLESFVYPNPASDKLFVNAKNFTVFNCKGKRMKICEQRSVEGSFLDIENFPAGVYIVSSGGKCQKFIKQ